MKLDLLREVAFTFVGVAFRVCNVAVVYILFFLGAFCAGSSCIQGQY